MECAWDRVEDTDVERECSSLIRLPLPPPEESDDAIDLDAPTMRRVPVLASASGPVPVQLAPMMPPQLVSRRAQLLLGLLAATAVALAIAVAVA